MILQVVVGKPLHTAVVWYLSLPWRNSSNKTLAAIIPLQTMLSKHFSDHLQMYNGMCVCSDSA